MIVYKGLLKRVGSKEGDMIVNTSGASAVGNVRVSGTISVIEIGDTVLRKVGCGRDLYDLLDPGKEAVLYVHSHFFMMPVILGISYPEERRNFKAGLGMLIGNAISYLLIFPVMFLIFGMASTVLLGGILGTLLTLGLLSLCGYNAYTLITGYMRVPG